MENIWIVFFALFCFAFGRLWERRINREKEEPVILAPMLGNPKAEGRLAREGRVVACVVPVPREQQSLVDMAGRLAFRVAPAW